ncbi:hypothetical protein WQQ_20880 [Hydrocarboniphaga effusa AP103]|uniref:Uncharacterized protein n=1 Tax=Hydrocarboniphaga effusa AP103 TaxID=1172194 RepID=I8I5V9_9GAMM|nr:hypothetical protein WQQ_20880 [Hydrocarboniphaga effusa AP103]
MPLLVELIEQGIDKIDADSLGAASARLIQGLTGTAAVIQEQIVWGHAIEEVLAKLEKWITAADFRVEFFSEPIKPALAFSIQGEYVLVVLLGIEAPHLLGGGGVIHEYGGATRAAQILECLVACLVRDVTSESKHLCLLAGTGRASVSR